MTHLHVHRPLSSSLCPSCQPPSSWPSLVRWERAAVHSCRLPFSLVSSAAGPLLQEVQAPSSCSDLCAKEKHLLR